MSKEKSTSNLCRCFWHHISNYKAPQLKQMGKKSSIGLLKSLRC